jgi:hypothetical protein
MLVTHWRLDGAAVVAGCIALAGGALALWALPRHKGGLAPGAAWAGLFAAFVAYVTLS